jgi:MYXO-CTERM domain-containing protein
MRDVLQAWRLVCVVAGLLPLLSTARSGGIAGYSGESGQDCSACHSGASAPSVTLKGPTTLAPGTSGTYALVITGGPAVGAGVDVAVSGGGTLTALSGTATQILSAELVQNANLSPSGSSISATFQLTAPSTTGPLTLYAAGLSDNGDGTTQGDGTATTTLQVTVANPSTGPPPTVVSPASAVPSVISGATSALAVLGVNGNDTISYTWSASGGGPVSFSPNGSAAAGNTTATFTAVGVYTLSVTLSDQVTGATAQSSCQVTVEATPASVAVSPTQATVAVGGTQQFTAQVQDQFQAAITNGPSATWSVSGGGTVSGTGLFTAGNSVGGPFSVSASAAGLTGNASVNISQQPPPTVTQSASANPAQVAGNTSQLSVKGGSAAGSTNLTYTWSVLQGDPGVSFSPNGTNAASATTATFTAAGKYNLQVAITDLAGDTNVSAVAVTVLQMPSSLSLIPATVTVAPLGSQQFTATLVDQFAAPFAQTPGIAWTVSGGGNINGVGLFVANGGSGGPFTVTAVTVDAQSSATLYVGNGQAPDAGATMGVTGKSSCSTGDAGFGLGLAFVGAVLLRRRRRM